FMSLTGLAACFDLSSDSRTASSGTSLSASVASVLSMPRASRCACAGSAVGKCEASSFAAVSVTVLDARLERVVNATSIVPSVARGAPFGVIASAMRVCSVRRSGHAITCGSYTIALPLSTATACGHAADADAGAAARDTPANAMSAIATSDAQPARHDEWRGHEVKALLPESARGAARLHRSLRFEQVTLAWPRQLAEMRLEALLGRAGSAARAIAVHVVFARHRDFLQLRRHRLHALLAIGRQVGTVGAQALGDRAAAFRHVRAVFLDVAGAGGLGALRHRERRPCERHGGHAGGADFEPAS